MVRAGIHGKLTNPEVKSLLDGNPGRGVLEVEGPGFKVVYRIYLVKNRLYQLIVLGDGSKGLADRVEPVFVAQAAQGIEANCS